jgi:hypothetical protein
MPIIRNAMLRHVRDCERRKCRCGMRRHFSMKPSAASARAGAGNRADGQSDTLRSICLTAPRPPRYMEKAFEVIGTSDYRRFPGPLEILLVPQTAVAAIVHAPIESQRGFALPLGFVSFDAAVLRRAEQCVLDNLNAYVADDSLYREVAAALSGQKP